ncbi:hypothetical protein ABK040_014406 [Willaertia magna]
MLNNQNAGYHNQQTSLNNNSVKLTSRVELHISARNLANTDILSKSDPRVLVYTAFPPNSPSYTWKLLGETETIRNNLNPNFSKTFVLDYCFEEVQHLRFAIYDIDNNTATLDDDDFIGDTQTTLGEICGSRGQKLIKHVFNHRKSNFSRGQIILQVEEITQNNDDIEIQFQGVNLAKMDFFGKSDPYFVIQRSSEDSSFLSVYKSETIMSNLNPLWQPLRMPIAKLCNGDLQRALKIQVYDWDKYSDDDLIGEVETNTEFLLKPTYPLKLINKARKPGKQNTGDLVVKGSKLLKNYSFLEFLGGGMTMSLIVAVDFTASNGDPNTPTSLHFNRAGTMNQYESAIRAVGQILAEYDHDKQFPTFGFGGFLPSGQTSHCFALNGNPQQPECNGVEGILQAYRQALFNVRLSGPTHFSQILQTASSYASRGVNNQQRQEYFVLLIITDGQINDMDATIEQLVAASSLPLSVVIVGVGNADFSSMSVLDGDDARLRTRYGQYAQRDIVQFVPFNKFTNLPFTALAKETLAEIPQQVCEFMRLKGITPGKKIVTEEYIPPEQQIPNPNVVNQMLLIQMLLIQMSQTQINKCIQMLLIQMYKIKPLYNRIINKYPCNMNQQPNYQQNNMNYQQNHQQVPPQSYQNNQQHYQQNMNSAQNTQQINSNQQNYQFPPNQQPQYRI